MAHFLAHFEQYLAHFDEKNLDTHTCCVRQTSGPRAHSIESSRTESDPETAILPPPRSPRSDRRDPITERDSPRSFRWAAASRGSVPTTWGRAS